MFVNVYLLRITGTTIDGTKSKRIAAAIDAHFQLHIFQHQLGLCLAADFAVSDGLSSLDAKI